jgi:hypothetical protein
MSFVFQIFQISIQDLINGCRRGGGQGRGPDAHRHQLHVGQVGGPGQTARTRGGIVPVAVVGGLKSIVIF